MTPAPDRRPPHPVEAVCQRAVDGLRAQGYPLASVYLAVGDRLRCMAVGAYGQLFDGIPPGIGAIGRAYATATRVQVRPGPDVEEYRAAADGVSEELALPLFVQGRCV